MNYYQRNDSRKSEKWQTIRQWLILIAELAAIAGFIWLAIYLCQGLGIAEGCKGPCWVLCSPTSTVNVRQKPRTSSEVIGWYEAGDKLMTDWETSGEFLHVVDLSLEYTEGWISMRYIVFDEPEWKGGEGATVIADGRVAIRRWIDGPRCSGKGGWAKPDSTLQVFWLSKDWCYTNRGYVQTKYLEVDER